MTERVDEVEASMLIEELNDTAHGIRLSRKAAKALCALLAERDALEAENQRLLEAIKYSDRINSYNKPLKPGESVPSWYMYAEERIEVIE